MLPRDYPIDDCDLARSLEVVGPRWTLLIVAYVEEGDDTFTGLRERLGVAPNVLADRLRFLIQAAVLRTEPLGASSRRRYRLTSRGQELLRVIEALRSWGQRNAITEGTSWRRDNRA